MYCSRLHKYLFFLNKGLGYRLKTKLSTKLSCNYIQYVNKVSLKPVSHFDAKNNIKKKKNYEKPGPF